MEVPPCLEIKPSPVHGLGVFAKEPIRSRKRLGEFTGVKYSRREFKAKYNNDYSYCYCAKRANYILSAKEQRNFMTYINESRTPNVEIVKRKLIALRDIQPGEELFLSYDRDYPRDYELESISLWEQNTAEC